MCDRFYSTDSVKWITDKPVNKGHVLQHWKTLDFIRNV